MVASAFYYNAGLAMGALRAAGAVQHAFAAWLGGISAAGKHFRRLYDKKARLRRLRIPCTCLKSVVWRAEAAMLLDDHIANEPTAVL